MLDLSKAKAIQQDHLKMSSQAKTQAGTIA